MKKQACLIVMVSVFLASISLYCNAAGTQGQAKAMVDKAIAYYKANGKNKTVEAVKDEKGQFIKDDLYVNIYSLKGIMLATPANPKLIGTDGTNVKDADGKPFMLELIGRAGKEGSGWVEYRWTHPKSRKVAPKTAYFEKVDDIIFSSGAYK